MQIPQLNPHPLKDEIKKSRLTYWQIRRLLNGCPSDSTLCRMLNGLIPMSDKVEQGLRQILAEVRSSDGQYPGV